MKTVMIVSRCSWTLYKFRLPLMQYMQCRGYRVIAAGNDEPEFTEKLTQADIEFFPIQVSGSSMSPWRDLKLIFRLRKIYRQQSVDIVQHFTIKPVIYGSMAARLAGVCNIVTVTGLGHVFTTGKGWLRRVVSTLYKVALSGAQCVFFQNPDDAELFTQLKLAKPGQIRLIKGSGVDTEQFSPLPNKNNIGLHFLMIARLIREKGIEEFLQAAEQVKEQYPDTQFTVIGDTDPYNPTALTSDEIEEKVQQGLLQWHGYQDDVKDYIHGADVVVLPSYREGTPKTLLEAAACGKAMITTDVPGCREVVKHDDNGLLVPAQDARALAMAMMELIKHRERLPAMGEHSRQRALTEFDQKLIFQQTHAIYQEVCKEH